MEYMHPLLQQACWRNAIGMSIWKIFMKNIPCITGTKIKATVRVNTDLLSKCMDYAGITAKALIYGLILKLKKKFAWTKIKKQIIFLFTIR